jgi:hypothetical protein
MTRTQGLCPKLNQDNIIRADQSGEYLRAGEHEDECAEPFTPTATSTENGTILRASNIPRGVSSFSTCLTLESQNRRVTRTGLGSRRDLPHLLARLDIWLSACLPLRTLLTYRIAYSGYMGGRKKHWSRESASTATPGTWISRTLSFMPRNK